MKSFRFLPIALLLCSFAFADENLPSQEKDVKSDDNQRISIYLHPVTLIAGMAAEPIPAFIYITGEYPISKFNSIIINPSIWTGGEDVFFRVGTGLGIRHFASGEASGLYLQLMPSIHYVSIDVKDDVLGKITGRIMDVMGYIGYSAKYAGISIFFDVGIGYQWAALSRDKSKKNDDEDSDSFFVPTSASGRYLYGDINFGIGIPLF
jgi:hypothetical protein